MREHSTSIFVHMCVTCCGEASREDGSVAKNENTLAKHIGKFLDLE